ALGSPHRPVSFVVPTGNFGDVLAGYVAKRMGLPISKLTIATNVNDILVRTLATGRYEVTGVEPSSSPSMDIQVSSNFERVLFETLERDAGALRGMMAALSQSGSFSPPNSALQAIRADFDAGRADEEQTLETIARVRRETGYLLDPHTAVAVSVAERVPSDPRVPQVVLATAHPAKFPDAVERACGERPALPPHLADLLQRQERIPTLPNDISAIEAYITKHARAASEHAA
ncbi:MAG TPA: threonine synthase, partial [Ancylobacter sp.]